jgi:hypothetical protein
MCLVLNLAFVDDATHNKVPFSCLHAGKRGCAVLFEDVISKDRAAV